MKMVDALGNKKWAHFIFWCIYGTEGMCAEPQEDVGLECVVCGSGMQGAYQGCYLQRIYST